MPDLPVVHVSVGVGEPVVREVVWSGAWGGGPEDMCVVPFGDCPCDGLVEAVVQDK